MTRRMGLLVLFVAAVLVGPSRGGGEVDGVHVLSGWTQPPSSSSSVPPFSLVLDGDLVDKIRSICLQDIVGAEEILGTGQTFAYDELPSRSSKSELKTMLLMELLALLPPDKSSVTHDCIRANYFSLGMSQEFINYLEDQLFLFGSDFYPRRRHLADQMVEDGPSSGGEAKFPLSLMEQPFTPPNFPNTEPRSRRLEDKPAKKRWGVPPPVSPSDKQHNYIKLVLTVVLPTAAFSFIAAFLIFYCCGCNKSKVSVGEPRDDHPLLHMQSANTPGIVT
uniref:Uncharacterized protein n=1 Tax=Aegilops tauschii subsp. strangulata TaxID=200361 RepID=A0A453NF54_AEGTS